MIIPMSAWDRAGNYLKQGQIYSQDLLAREIREAERVAKKETQREMMKAFMEFSAENIIHECIKQAIEKLLKETADDLEKN